MKIFIRRALLRIFALSLVFSLASVTIPRASALEEPDILAEAALLVESTTGQILYQKNIDSRRAPASLTKIMTVMLAVESYTAGDVSLDDVVTVSDTAYSGITADGSTAGLMEGEELSFLELLYCAMLPSANEACNVLAEYLSGDIDTFVDRMNQRAAELGCTNTHFANTHGMPNDNHYSTAYDLYLITRNAMSLPLFEDIVSVHSHTVPATNLSEARQLTSTNILMDPNSRYYYKYASGVKTGHTDAAGYCLISTASNEDRQMLSVVLGANSVVIEDGTTQVQSFSETIKLFDWGFENFSYQEILSTMNLVTEVPVRLARGRSSVVLRPAEKISALLANDVDISSAVLTPTVYNIENNEELFAPIDQGTVLGSVSVSLDGVDYGSVNLVANTAVTLDKLAYIKYEIGRTLSNTWVRLFIVLLFLLLCLYIAFIIVYNKNRRKRKIAADALARKRIEELRRGESTSTGNSFEEIEDKHRTNEEETSKLLSADRPVKSGKGKIDNFKDFFRR